MAKDSAGRETERLPGKKTCRPINHCVDAAQKDHPYNVSGDIDLALELTGRPDATPHRHCQ
jgi:hypothetical protein